MDNKSGICALCYNTFSSYNLEEIVQDTKEILNVLLIQINPEDNKPVMCLYCSDKVKVLFKFKSACLYVEDFISPFAHKENGNEVDLKELFIREKGHTNLTLSFYLTKILLNRNLCRLCMEVVDVESTCLDGSDTRIKSLKYLIEKCIPEMKINSSKNAAVCDACIAFLEDYSDFLVSCAHVKEMKYKDEANKSDGTGDVKESINLTPVSNINQTFKKENDYQIKTEEIDIKSIDCSEDHRESLNGTGNFIREDDSITDTVAPMPLLSDPHLGIFKSNTCDNLGANTALSIKQDQENYCDDYVEEKPPKNKQNRKSQQGITRLGTRNMRKGQSQTKWFNCDSCGFKTKRKDNLKTHMLVHKDASNVDWFYCDSCNFKAKQKSYLKRHMVVHKGSPESFTCHVCNFKSKWKHHLKTHMLVHKNASEIGEWFSCDLCNYKAKHRTYLNRHMMVHRDSSEWFSCNSCSFKSIRKHHLKRHMLSHKDPLVIEWFKCDLCDFKAKHKQNLKMHRLVHKDPSEIEWFKCDSCCYKSKCKRLLKTHLAIHRNPSHIDWFKCDSCDFKAKRKYHLEMHMLVHKNPSEMEWLKCNLCTFKGRTEDYLKTHIRRVHKNKKDTYGMI